MVLQEVVEGFLVSGGKLVDGIATLVVLLKVDFHFQVGLLAVGNLGEVEVAGFFGGGGILGRRWDVPGRRWDVPGLRGDVPGLRGDVRGRGRDVRGRRWDVVGRRWDVIKWLGLRLWDVKRGFFLFFELLAAEFGVLAALEFFLLATFAFFLRFAFALFFGFALASEFAEGVEGFLGERAPIEGFAG
jgi:hypothetical protein